MAKVLSAQGIVAGDIGLRLPAKRQRLRGIDHLDTARLIIDQPMQQVDDMVLVGTPASSASWVKVSVIAVDVNPAPS